eukprot:Nitzschia sp. Nitz4//scaffold233_size31335//14167//15325//NITZ4_007950-RA/size31335-snap-gene-0.13-mRNA-1//1//CDS//3329543376//41//frame0
MSPMMTILHYLGIYKSPGARWGWDYTTTMFSRIAWGTYKYQRSDLIKWLGTPRSWGFLQQMFVMPFLFSEVPEEDQKKGIWDVWYLRSLETAKGTFQSLAGVLFGIFFVISVLAALYRDSSCFATSGFVGATRNIVFGAFLLGVLHLSVENVSMNQRSTISWLLLCWTVSICTVSNIAWRDIVEQSSSLFCGPFQNLPFSKEEAEERIVKGVVSSVGGRFLYQMPYSGNFAVLSSSEANKLTRRALMKTCDPTWMMLDQSISFMISHSRLESYLRSTAMATMGVNTLEYLRGTLFGDQDKTEVTTEFVSNHRCYQMLPQFNRFIPQRKSNPLLGSHSPFGAKRSTPGS